MDSHIPTSSAMASSQLPDKQSTPHLAPSPKLPAHPPLESQYHGSPGGDTAYGSSSKKKATGKPQAHDRVLFGLIPVSSSSKRKQPTSAPQRTNKPKPGILHSVILSCTACCNNHSDDSPDIVEQYAYDAPEEFLATPRTVEEMNQAHSAPKRPLQDEHPPSFDIEKFPTM